MNVNEFATIAAALKASYPNANLMPDKHAKDVWYTMLADLEYKVCLAAVKELISTHIFPPAIAEIRETCAGITMGELPDWGSGWEAVMHAIRRYGMYQEKEAVDSLDEITAQCVKRLGFQNLCTSENIAADRANFRMIYEQISSRKKNRAQQPDTLLEEKERLQQLINTAALALGEWER